MQHPKWIVEDTNDMLRDVTYESFIYKTTAEEVEKVLTAFAEHMSIGCFSCFREVKVPSWADFGIAILESGCALRSKHIAHCRGETEWINGLL